MNDLQFCTPYPQSIVQADDATYFLTRAGKDKVLGIIGNADGFEAQWADGYWTAPLNAHTAAALRERLPWLRPQPLGLRRTVGLGDRLGLATPGHIRALRATSGFAPVFAQQSVRENQRTGRTPAQVLDDAMWGVFQEGWREPWGADADHLKSIEALDDFIAAGYTLFTIDPGDHVDNRAAAAPLDTLRALYRNLSWDALADTPEGMRARYEGRSFSVERYTLQFDELTFLRAACKYAGAIRHTAELYRYLAARLHPSQWEMEVSVDETETPTSPEEHFFIATELARLGVRWVSLAPRYIGRFEKGVDYIGSLDDFEADFARHAAIARALGPYKLSLHSGSDKFRIYPIVARYAGDRLHLKTAGTSYLEALRTVASVDPLLFRDILRTACDRYETDRATYHVSADLAKVLDRINAPDSELPRLLDEFHARQVLHVTFGSVLERHGGRLRESLAQHEEAHWATLQAHLTAHLNGFRV